MKWLKSDIDGTKVQDIARRFNIEPLDAAILLRRGVCEPEQLLFYLEDNPRHLRNPFLFDRMEDAVDRILLARDEGEKILVFGDADADGVTSTVIMVETLRSLGAAVSWRLPVEDDPYGLSMAAVEEFAAAGGTLIITVDCGISNHAEVLRATALSVDVIIVDHHRLQGEAPPEALAVINPKLPDSGYPFRDLAGCGVAYKVSYALRFAQSGLYKQPVALLNITPAPAAPAGDNPEIFIIEAVKLHNLVETRRLCFRASAQDRHLALDKLASFLGDRQIFVWDKSLQTRMVTKLFGSSVDIHFYDIAQDIGESMPATRGKSLFDLAPLSRLHRYRDGDSTEIDLFASLFTSFALDKAGLLGDSDADLVQLAALGTLADLMPLRDENRILVKRGLSGFNSKPRNGVRELLDIAGPFQGPMGSHEVSWQIIPLINAAGRMGKPDLAVHLFMDEEAQGRSEAARRIAEANKERRKSGSEAWERVLPAAQESFAKHKERFALVGSKDVPPGITGLIASRVTGILKVPAVIAAFKPSGDIVGSIRTARGLPISGLLAACADLFVDYGGHDAAAGFSMSGGRWEEFSRRAAEYMAATDMSSVEEALHVDAELPHDMLVPSLKNLADRFEPYGEGNRPLVLMATKVPMLDAQIVGKSGKSHLKLTLDFGSFKWPALLWDGAERLERDFSFRNRDMVDILFKVTVNRWNGEERPQLELYDICRSGQGA